MKIVLGSDHAGRELRRRIEAHLSSRGHEVLSLGTDNETSVDYPDFARDVALEVAEGQAERGILVCGTGMGMQIAANKVRGIRAVTPYDEETARMSRLHNDSNIACFGERVQDAEKVIALADLWLETPFEGGRHSRRLDKIRELEGQREDDPTAD